jgi:formate hydrogenlyase subunit 6/NADH:ubiquinone oxidoreductase subunit I
LRIGTMLKDVIGAIFKRPITEKYPFERRAAPERLRGVLNWNPEKCVGCGLCAKDCPSDALEVINIDRAKKEVIIRYHVDRCTYCSQCVVNCRFNCLDMSNEKWEMAALNKEAFTIYYGDEALLEKFLGKKTEITAGEEVVS